MKLIVQDFSALGAVKPSKLVRCMTSQQFLLLYFSIHNYHRPQSDQVYSAALFNSQHIRTLYTNNEQNVNDDTIRYY